MSDTYTDRPEAYLAGDRRRTAGNGQATLLNVGSLTVGSHRIAVRVTYSNGTIAILSNTFNR